MEKKVKKNAAIGVGNAVIWASVMLASAWVTKGSEGSQDLLMILIVGWLMSSFLITRKS